MRITIKYYPDFRKKLKGTRSDAGFVLIIVLFPMGNPVFATHELTATVRFGLQLTEIPVR